MSTAPTRSSSATSTGPAPSHALAACIVDAVAERKALDVTVLDLRATDGGVADFFVIATGGSDRQIRALTRGVDERAKEQLGEKPWHIEGQEHGQWVVLDYVNVVVHLFSKEKRTYYDLERLWGDADVEHVPEEAGSAAVDLLQPDRDAS